jgi:hypothetical protein
MGHRCIGDNNKWHFPIFSGSHAFYFIKRNIMYRTPGVYRKEIVPVTETPFQTGVPAFVGLTRDRVGEPIRLHRWSEFRQLLGEPLVNSYLADAVRGFFANSSHCCYVLQLPDDVLQLPKERTQATLEAGLARLETIAEVDLICFPDLAGDLVLSLQRVRDAIANNEPDFRLQRLAREALAAQNNVIQWQQLILDRCARSGDRFAILDSLPYPALLASLSEATTAMSFSPQDLRERWQQVDPLLPLLEQRRKLVGTNGALYGTWLDTGKRDGSGGTVWVPPCGHVAGVYARSDERFGVQKAPANEVLEGVADVEVNFDRQQSDRALPEHVNCLRSLSGRGIRIWGARTLSRDASWTYVNVRRLFLTLARWSDRYLTAVAFEPHDARLWNRIRREVSGYLNGWFRQGALQGSSPQEAFFVKCDAQNNPPENREKGKVVVEVGLAPLHPSEFIVVRLVQTESGLVGL